MSKPKISEVHNKKITGILDLDMMQIEVGDEKKKLSEEFQKFNGEFVTISVNKTVEEKFE